MSSVHGQTSLEFSLPLVGAMLIAISRLEDYRHDVYDVTIGSLLGTVIAYFSYRRYYPSLRSAQCDDPYPSRADVAAKAGSKRKDEASRVEGRGRILDSELSEAMPLREASGELED